MTPNPLDAAQEELDATWRAMNSPKTTAADMRRLYARAAELRRIISTLENSPNGN